MTTRTDVHAPSNIVTEDYQFVTAMTRCGDPMEDALERSFAIKEFNAHMEITGGKFSTHDHKGDCHVCGASMIDYAIYYHAPTNSYIKTGQDCAEKIDGGHPEAFKSIRTERQAIERAKAGKMKARVTLGDHGILEAVEGLFVDGNINGRLLEREGTSGMDRDLQERVDLWIITIGDIVRKLVTYGDLSEKQWAFLVSLLDRINNVDDIQAERTAEREGADPAPEGRVQVEGVVLSTRLDESRFGIVEKMLLKDDRGFKVWCSVPKAIEVEKGVRVKMVVTLEKSEDDHSFAFGKRPSKASII